MKLLSKTLLISVLFTLALGISAAGATPTRSSEVNPNCSEEVQQQQREVDEQKDLDGDGFVGLGPSSGFVDENDCPISEEEYAKIRDEQSKGIFEKQPIASAAVAIVLIGLIAGGIVLLVKRKNNQ